MKVLLFLLFTLALAHSQSSCNFFKVLGCTQAIVQASSQCSGQDFNTITSCISGVLNSIQQPDCMTCICDVLPDLCGSSLQLTPQQTSTCVKNCQKYAQALYSDPKQSEAFCYQKCKLF